LLFAVPAKKTFFPAEIKRRPFSRSVSPPDRRDLMTEKAGMREVPSHQGIRLWDLHSDHT
jgi:hypothetical protein